MNNLFSLDITKVKIPHLQDTIAKLYTEGLVGADSLAEAALVIIIIIIIVYSPSHYTKMHYHVS